VSNIVPSQNNLPAAPIHPIYSAFPPAPGFSPIPSLVRFAADTVLETGRQVQTAQRLSEMFDLQQRYAMGQVVSGMILAAERDAAAGFLDPDVAKWVKEQGMKTLRKAS
jgi:hypothetical protein